MRPYENTHVNKKLRGKKTIFCKGDYYDWDSAYNAYISRKKKNVLQWEDIVPSTPPK